jgi:hypothetical protein
MDTEKPFEDVMGKFKQFENVMGKIKQQEIKTTPTAKDVVETKKQEVSVETQLPELKESIKKEESRSNLETELYEGTFADQLIQKQEEGGWGCLFKIMLGLAAFACFVVPNPADVIAVLIFIVVPIIIYKFLKVL